MAFNALKADPSRTAGLRRSFVADMGRRFRKLRVDVWKLVYTEDAFGLRLPAPTFNTRWVAKTNDAKLKSFQEWLAGEIESGILTLDPLHAGEPWTAKYVYNAHKQGMLRARAQTTKPSFKGDAFQAGVESQFVAGLLNAPVLVSKLKLLGIRSFEDLKGITSAMSVQMSRILADGLAQGKSIQLIAKELTDTIDGMYRTRAEVLARTEIIRAHAEGQLDSFEALGVRNVVALVEMLTADGACPQCLSLSAAGPYTIEEARGIIPVHARCRCAWGPGPIVEN